MLFTDKKRERNRARRTGGLANARRLERGVSIDQVTQHVQNEPDQCYLVGSLIESDVNSVVVGRRAIPYIMG